jgi:hypothetical protein
LGEVLREVEVSSIVSNKHNKHNRVNPEVVYSLHSREVILV